MDDDQQVAVLLQLNINENVTPWNNDLSPQTANISINESNGSDQQNLDKDVEDNNLFEKDFEFLRKHAADADPEFLHSLLNSQADNPNRLEVVMCDMLSIPNAQELIQEFQSKSVKVGEKRANQSIDPDSGDSKKQKTTDSESYLKQIRDMFPDADGLFLISECQQLESWEDCSRFINTVMLSGVYPKKDAAEYTSSLAEPSRVVDVVNDNNYRFVQLSSSDSEASSTELLGSPGRKKSRKKKSNSNSPSNSQDSVNADIEVVDIASDNTETYEIPDANSLREHYQENYAQEFLQPPEEPLAEFGSLETGFMEDIKNLLQAKFGDPISPVASGSMSKTPRSRLSLPDNTLEVQEKSLAEIIEEKRHDRRRSLDSTKDVVRPSTSKAEDWERPGGAPEVQDLNDDASSKSESTAKRLGFDLDAVNEEGEETPVVSEEWLSEQTANLIRIFPNTDPSYLREEVEKMNGSANAVNEFVESKLEKNDMPTRAEYEQKKEMEELQNRYTKNFSIEDFLKAVPDPWAYFSDDSNRNCAKYKSHSLCYLKSAFRKHYVREIIDAFNRNNFNLFKTYQCLKKEKMKLRGSRRSEFECNNKRPMTIDIQFLQEVAFIENEDKILEYIENKKRTRQLKFEEAKRSGSLLECQCCFDSEVMVEDIVYCPKDHAFCKDCIVKAVEVEMGSGRCQFECLANCSEKFTLACFQNVLKPELFSKVIQANQIEEIRAAEIEDLVQCPFCNYATIMPPEEKVMTCLNPECLKESCRSCKELNHIPLRCEEVEKSEEVKMRTYIENKMTEALVRTCYKCNKKFVKEDGCNKMTCTCGAKMCYVCRQPVTDYSHFNGQGGTEYHKCPLYSMNDELHVELVRRVGEEAKAEILQANPQTKLMHDPTLIMPERTHDVPMPGVNNGIALDVGLRAVRGNNNQQEPEVVEDRRRRTVGHPPRRNRHEDNPYYNRYHRHRQQAEVESEDEESDEGEPQQRDNHHHHHYHHHNPIHHRHHRGGGSYRRRSLNRHPHRHQT